MAMNNRLLRPLQTPGLLDLVPGAAAAYSLRSLSRSYADPVVTVRRSSDDDEGSFTASEVADGTLAAWCGAGDGFVKQWWDQSGNARHAVAAADANEPQIVDSGVVVTEEGKPAIQFDGSDDYLSIGSLGLVGNIARSVFAVVSPQSYPSGTGSPFLGRVVGSALSGQLFELCVESGQFAVRVLGNAIFTDTANNLQQRLWAVLFPGGNSDSISVHKDGAPLAYSTGAVATLATVDSNFAIGAGTSLSLDVYFTGNMQELIIYPSDLTEQRELIEGNIAWGWSV